MSASERTAFLQAQLDELREAGLFNTIRTVESPMDARITVDGRTVLNFCANNYLGLANHPALRAAARAAIDEYGVGPGAVRSIAGTQQLHRDLETRLAAFKGAEAVLTLQSGFAANLATIPALVGRGDVIFSDRLNHASIIDGCRLSRAQIVAYDHADAKDLARRITETPCEGRRLIISDGVFSMDGDIAPLPALVEVAERHDCLIMVDDAHGEGVLGNGGRGIVDHYGMHGRVDHRNRHDEQGVRRDGRLCGWLARAHRLAEAARPALHLLQRADRGGYGRLPGGGRSIDGFGRARATPLAKTPKVCVGACASWALIPAPAQRPLCP